MIYVDVSVLHIPSEICPAYSIKCQCASWQYI